MSFFPVTLNNYWFITVYVMIYILSPYYNRFAHALDRKTFKNFLITLLVFFSILPTIWGFFFNNSEVILFYNRFIWLSVMYFIGVYIRLYKPAVIGGLKRSGILSVCSLLFLCGSILIIRKCSGFFAAIGTFEPAYFWPPNTLPIILLSIGIFGIFLSWKIPYIPIVNRIASTTLAVYLLHDGVLVGWIWGTVFHCADYMESVSLVPHILFAALCVVTVGAVIDLFRQFLEKYTLKKLLDLFPGRNLSKSTYPE